ncbi:hypothetical protein, partial [Mycolicibacterium mucogenicum]|uniref:hypothetical protein n=1 Tax=Mycolicibacterium mucogenicum TaxID=56689 RepID=UPI001CDC1F42
RLRTNKPVCIKLGAVHNMFRLTDRRVFMSADSVRPRRHGPTVSVWPPFNPIVPQTDCCGEVPIGVRSSRRLVALLFVADRFATRAHPAR